jgi:hypothetical protein
MSASYLDTPATFLDKLKGVALIATFLGVLAVFATWVMLWDSVWRTAVEPTRVNIYSAQMSRALDHSACLRSSFWWWRSAGCRLI